MTVNANDAHQLVREVVRRTHRRAAALVERGRPGRGEGGEGDAAAPGEGVEGGGGVLAFAARRGDSEPSVRSQPSPIHELLEVYRG